jgi:predicted SAM-dependent methyltransferase
MLRRTRTAVISRVSAHVVRWRNPNRQQFDCPICAYHGAFLDMRAETGKRSHVECPGCQARERHRLQWLVLRELEKECDFSKLRVLHVAPEEFFESRLRGRCASYLTTDISAKGVDCNEDLTALTFADESFDLVYASHVLEHIQNDDAAIREIRRVLSPSGMAVLPVPIVSDSTVEYGAPNPYEVYHVRAPGVDYFEKYRQRFGRVRVFESASFDERFQVWIHEDRSRWPTENMPRRRSMPGKRHSDYVPVCYAN